MSLPRRYLPPVSLLAAFETVCRLGSTAATAQADARDVKKALELIARGAAQ